LTDPVDLAQISRGHWARLQACAKAIGARPGRVMWSWQLLLGRRGGDEDDLASRFRRVPGSTGRTTATVRIRPRRWASAGIDGAPQGLRPVLRLPDGPVPGV